MRPPDLKRLITGFLILASLTSSLTLVFSRFLTSKANPVETVEERASFLEGAFSKQTPENLNQAENRGARGNLTQNLASTIAGTLIEKNLTGPATPGEKMGITIPADLEAIVSRHLSATTTAVQFPTAVDEERLNLKKGAPKEEVEIYFTEVESIFKTFESAEFKSLESKAKGGSVDGVLLGAFVLFYSQIETRLYETVVPEIALAFHKELLTLVHIPIVIFGQNIDADPLKATSLVTEARNILETTKIDLLKEMHLLKVRYPTLAPKTSFLGIPVAYAQFAVFDPINWIENFLSEIFNTLDYYLNYDSWYGDILTEKLKDKLLKLVVNSILNWANGGSGGGQSSFIGDWKTFLQESFNVAASQAVEEVTTGLCEPFRLKLQLQLRSLYSGKSYYGGLGSPRASDLGGCVLEEVVADLGAFQNDFNEGSWAGYNALTSLEGNYYGNLFLKTQQVQLAAEKASEGAKQEAASGGGYTGTKRCANGASPVGGACADGSTPEITTPGSNIGQTTTESLTSAIHRIVNAQDWKGLATQLALMAITKVTSNGNKGIRYGNVTGDAPADKYAACAGYPAESAEYAACKKNIDDAGNAGGGHGNQQALLLQAEQALKDATATMELYTLSIEAATTSIGVLNEIIAHKTQCTAEGTQAENELSVMTQRYNDLLVKADDLLSLISRLQEFIDDIKSHDEADQDYFLQKLDEFQTEFGGPGAFAQKRGQAQADNQDLQSKLQQISDLLKACLD